MLTPCLLHSPECRRCCALILIIIPRVADPGAGPELSAEDEEDREGHPQLWPQ